MSTSAVCIVNYNTRHLLRECVRSVLAEGPSEIIVVDNASNDGSAEMVEVEFPSVTLIRSGGNVGYGPAANRAIRSSRADDILLLNADTIVRPGALAALRGHLAKAGAATILGPRLFNPDGTYQTSCFHFPTPPHVFLYLSGLFRVITDIPFLNRRSLQRMSADSAVRVPWVLGAALAFHRATFQSLGGFDETFFMYFEEVDLCRRLTEGGGEVLFVPAAEVVHVGEQVPNAGGWRCGSNSSRASSPSIASITRGPLWPR